MQQQAALAYQQTAKRTVSPRDLEANLLSRSASTLQRIRDNWADTADELPGALRFNRRLWNIFVSSVTRPDSALPASMRQNVANLGLFVMRHTLKLEISPQPARLDVLITINRELAAGLRANQSPYSGHQRM